MAATFTLSGVPEIFPSGDTVLFGAVTMDASYPTGGEDISGLFSTYLSSITDVMAFSDAGYVPEYASPKLKAMYGDYSESSDGPLVEVADTTDLHTVSFPVIVRGKTA